MGGGDSGAGPQRVIKGSQPTQCHTLGLARGSAPSNPGRGELPPPPFTPPLPSPAPGNFEPGSHPGLPRSTDPLGQVAGPVVHEPAPALEQVRARIGGLDPVADQMRQGHLDHLLGVILLFTRPVPEGRAGTVRHSRNRQLAQYVCEIGLSLIRF